MAAGWTGQAADGAADMTERRRHMMTRPELRAAHKAACERVDSAALLHDHGWWSRWSRRGLRELTHWTARRDAFHEALYGHTAPRAMLPQEVSVISTPGCTSVSVALTNPEPVCADCGRDLPQDGNCGCAANAEAHGRRSRTVQPLVGGSDTEGQR